jgi:hypothetical protein
VAPHHFLGFPHRLFIVLASSLRRDAYNVIVPRQGIKPILWHVDLLSFPNRPIDAEIFSAVERHKILREKNLPAGDRTWPGWRRRHPDGTGRPQSRIPLGFGFGNAAIFENLI